MITIATGASMRDWLSVQSSVMASITIAMAALTRVLDGAPAVKRSVSASRVCRSVVADSGLSVFGQSLRPQSNATVRIMIAMGGWTKSSRSETRSAMGRTMTATGASMRPTHPARMADPAEMMTVRC